MSAAELLEETFVLTESAERWRERAERAEAEVAYLRRELVKAEPTMFARADRTAWRLIEKMQHAGRGQLVSIDGKCRYLGAYEARAFILRWDRAIDRCHRITRGEPAFGRAS